MEWFNVCGLIFMAIIMIPNVLFMRKHPEGLENAWHNPLAEALEQIGRFGCFALMIFNIPGAWFGFASDEAFALYLIVDSALVLCYCGIWAVCFRRNSRFRALSLSILPSALFLFSGIVSRSVPLVLAAALFAPCHILISWKNAVSGGQP
ncbi:MAG: hypothetical protein ACI4MF_01420 [Candidatus Faecivicinus sp.]